MERLRDRLQDWIGQVVVIDCAHPYVAIGKLHLVAEDYLELHHADMHDLRDSDTTRELYVAKAAEIGVQDSRKVLFFLMNQVVGISRLKTSATLK